MIYYLCLIAVVMLLLEISVFLVKGKRVKTLSALNFFSGLTMFYFLLSTNLMVAGVESIGYSVTREAGEHYLGFQLYTMMMLMLTVIVCAYGYIVAEKYYAKVQCAYVILAMIMMAFPICVAMVLMAAGLKVNAAVSVHVLPAMYM